MKTNSGGERAAVCSVCSICGEGNPREFLGRPALAAAWGGQRQLVSAHADHSSTSLPQWSAMDEPVPLLLPHQQVPDSNQRHYLRASG